MPFRYLFYDDGREHEDDKDRDGQTPLVKRIFHFDNVGKRGGLHHRRIMVTPSGIHRQISLVGSWMFSPEDGSFDESPIVSLVSTDRQTDRFPLQDCWRICPIKTFKLRRLDQTSVTLTPFDSSKVCERKSLYNSVTLMRADAKPNWPARHLLLLFSREGLPLQHSHPVFLDGRFTSASSLTRVNCIKTITVHLLVKLNMPEGKIKDLKCCCLTRTFNLYRCRASPRSWGKEKLFSPYAERTPLPGRPLSNIKALDIPSAKYE